MHRHLAFALNLSAAVAVSLLAQARATAQTPYPTTEIPCPFPAALVGEVYGETYTCGFLTVPENYDEPNGRQIELSYTVFYSQSLSPAPDPVIYLHGGPGGGSIIALDQYSETFAAQRRTRDVVLFAQRGTQFSNRLGCAPVAYVTSILNNEDNEYYAQFQDLLTALQARYPEASDDDIYEYAYFLLCGQILEGQGNDLDQYNTANNAQDVVNLATALGYDDINLYGISYGTYLAQQVMRDYPDRLRSVVLDSTLPQQVHIHEAQVKNIEQVLFNLIEDCQADAACAAAYPDLKTRTIELVAQIAESPIPLPTPIPDPENPDETIDAVTAEQFETIVGLLSAQPNLVSPYVPLMIQELEQGETTTFAGILTGDLLAEGPTEPQIGNEILNLQVEAEQLRLEASQLQLQQALQAYSDRPGSQWVNQAIAAAQALPPAQAILETANLLGVGYQSGQPRDRGTLLDYVAETFDGDTARFLTASLNALSDIEVRHAYEFISYTTDQSVLDLDKRATRGLYWSVVCNDIRPFGDPAVTDAMLASMDIPALGQSQYADAQDAYTICDTWPVEPARDAPFDAVDSDIPTLVLQGRYDLATTTAVGPQVMGGLSKGVLVGLPNSGHSVMNFSQCAIDIGEAFVNDPEQEPDTSCTADLAPEFVLPSAAAPTPVSTAPSPNSGPTTYTTVVDDSTILIEIFDGEGFYFRGPLTQEVEGGDYAGLNDWVQVLMNPATGRVQVVQIGTGEVLFDYR
jgi:pimeloyl-ACP methyl ester carboxylesterase